MWPCTNGRCTSNEKGFLAPLLWGKFASQKVDFMFGGDGKADLSRHEKDHVSMYQD
jgi:hypothetical protein